MLPTLDNLAAGSPLQIYGELTLPVAFSVVVRPKTQHDQVHTLAAFPVAAALVRRWLARHLTDVELLPANSNAAAARDVAEGRCDAAISTPLAALRYGLATLADGVVDEPNARTRFVLVGPPGVPPPRTGADRTSVVLRIDSPGGSVFASERIRREVDLIRQAGKPVVASMSSVAASGGYWVALAADEIWAGTSTLTGSIGIFGMFPDLSGLLARGGLSVDGVGTSPIAGGLDPRRPLSEPMSSALKSSIEHGYRRFVGLVASAREMDAAAVEQVAQGQVWSGAQALEHGLVDHLGGLDAALASAAARAGLDAYRVEWVEPELDARERILERLLHALGLEGPDRSQAAGLAGLVTRIVGELGSLVQWNDPGHMYAHCECVPP